MSECKFAVEAFHAYIESIGLSRPAGTLGELKAFKAGADWQRSQEQEELAVIKAKAAVPDGWKLVAVNGSFSDLMYYLDRASVKGYLDRLYDLVEPWEAFDYEYIENAAAPSQPQSDAVPDAAMSICGDTGCAEVDSLIGRLMSSDPDFEDCTAAAALLRRLSQKVNQLQQKLEKHRGDK